jgi:hypothetical protein
MVHDYLLSESEVEREAKRWAAEGKDNSTRTEAGNFRGKSVAAACRGAMLLF